jgi:predicted ester cyclase
MSGEENKKIVRQNALDFNACGGDVSKIRTTYEKYIGPDFIHHGPRGDMNREQRIQYVLMMMPAMPDLNYREEEMIAERDKVVTRYTASFTHKGAFMGIPPTGKQIIAKGVEINKIRDGKIVETWDFMDYLGIMIQLGIVPGASTKK